MASQTPKKGDYAPPSSTDLRSPCPILNSLANHGHLSRTGKDITLEELRAALFYLGIGPDMVSILAGAFKVNSTTPVPNETVSARGLRDATDVTSDGVKVLRLDKVGRPHAVEHDVSLSREDRALGDFFHANPELVKQVLGAAANGKTFTSADWVKLRQLRYQQQKERNPDLDFTPETHQTCAGELALLQGIFGQGWSWEIPVNFVKSLLEKEQLPISEGWKPRWSWCTIPEVFYLRTYIEGPSSPFKK